MMMMKSVLSLLLLCLCGMADADKMSPFYALNVESEERKLEHKRDSELHGFGPRGFFSEHMGRGLGVGDRGSMDTDDSSSSKGGKGKPKLSSKKTGKGGKGDFAYKSLSSSSSSTSGSGSTKGGKGGSSGSGSGSTKGGKGGSSGSGSGSSKSGKKNSKKNGALQNFNFVLESTEVQSLTAPADFALTTTITLRGNLFNFVDVVGASTKGTENLGDFRGICTITGAEQYLCTYELYFRTDGEVQAGGLNIRGPVAGSESVAVVTGTSFDFSIYDTGSVTLIQDPNNAWLIAKTELYLQNY